jgi:hypothetical protein
MRDFTVGGGGGGAGGLLTSDNTVALPVTIGQTYPVIVGGGGAWWNIIPRN